MTEDFCKLVSGIILSSIWREDDHTRILWITMLALKGRDHRVLASVPGLAAVANIPISACRDGLAKLMAPDQDSRTKEHEGRRIVEVEGGWLIVNGEKYRNYLSKQERNEYQAKLMAKRRTSKKLAPVSSALAPVSTKLAMLAQAEAEAEAEEEESKPREKKISLGYIVPSCFESVNGFPAALAGWIEARRAKQNPPTGRAIQLLINRLSERPGDAIAALDEATGRGWATVKWEWIDRESAKTQETKAPKNGSLFLSK